MYFRHQSKNKVCCKVYHTYCLAYYNENADPNVKWICGRHFCDICGNKYSVKFACRFCPLSFCEGNCAVKFAAEHGSRFISLPRELEASAIAWSSNQNVSLIICHACITLVEACVERGLLPAGILKGRSIQQLDAMALPSDTSSQHRLEGESIINEEGNAVCDNCDEWTEDDFLTLRQAVRLFPEPLFADRKLQVICPAAVTRALGAPEHVWLLERYSMEEICAKVLEINQPGHSSAYRLRAAPSSVTSTSDPKTVNISTVTLSAMSGKEQEVIPPSSWTMEHFQLLGLALKAYPLKENDAFNMPLYVYHRITTDPAYCELARYSHSSCKIATRRLLTSASHKNESSQVTTAAISSDAHVKNE